MLKKGKISTVDSLEKIIRAQPGLTLIELIVVLSIIAVVSIGIAF